MSQAAPPRVVLVGGAASYRAGAFQAAAQRLGIDAVLAQDIPPALREQWQSATLAIDLNAPADAAETIVAYHQTTPIAGIVALDDSATLVAALAAQRLGLPHNDPRSAEAARDKWVMRRAFASARLPVPSFRPLSISTPAAAFAQTLDYPCVLKPTRLSGSRGVIRVDSPEAFCAAHSRVSAMLLREGTSAESESMLVEAYLPGVEVAVEGLLTGGELTVLALFDKPDPLEGPFFEETIYVTPSRLPAETQRAIHDATATAASAVGLRQGPVHAELRINDEGVWVIEIAGRSIGGLCSTVLEFGAGLSLEGVILRQAAQLPATDTGRSATAAGVMMIPIPRSGVLRCVEGVDEAASVSGVTGIDITARLNYPITALPEGASYLGFIFARAETPQQVEIALREAHQRLTIRIEPLIPLARA